MFAVKESWGQLPISCYDITSDGKSLYATRLDDPYGELACSNSVAYGMPMLTLDDMEDLRIFEASVGESAVEWKAFKEELAQDGIL